MKELLAGWFRSFPVVFFVLSVFWGIPNIWSLVIGVVPVIAGTLILRGSTLEQNGEFAPAGLYRFSRGAGYFANTLVYTGYSVMTFALFPYMQVFGFIALWLFYKKQLAAAETLLLKKYGEVYTKYKSSVPEFFPLGFTLGGKAVYNTGIVGLNVFLTVSIVLLWFFRRLS